jgi:hypothetical protein
MPICYLLPVGIVNRREQKNMNSRHMMIEAWRESNDNQQDLLEAIQKLIPDYDHALDTLILAYGEACKQEARAIMAGGFKDNTEAMAAWLAENSKEA